MYVVATAGHVDHGKSALVRALTGMEPDRWAEERRRGITLDLGYAWTRLPVGERVEDVAFVDVPGHERFVPTMLAGVGPVPAVLFVVAADGGWMPQSTEHLDALDALGVRHGLVAVTRSDLADPGPALAAARERLARTSLGSVPAVAVSALTGAGLPELRAALVRLLGTLPAPDAGAPVRLWVDRAFTIRGSGTVVTGTLGAGTIRVGDELALDDGTAVAVRGLQALAAPVDAVSGTARVAVNLRGVPVAAVSRGAALVTPGAWTSAAVLDVAVTGGDLPAELMLHAGSAAVPVRVRPLGAGAARLTLRRPLPVHVGDRMLLRDPGRHAVAAGVRVLGVDPPPLRRRGAATARAAELAALLTALRPPEPVPGDAAGPVSGDAAGPASGPAAGSESGDASGVALRRAVGVGELARRGAVRVARLRAMGLPEPAGAVRVGEWLVDADRAQRWRAELRAAVAEHAAAHPLEHGLPVEAARRRLDLPAARLVELLVGDGLVVRDGRVLAAAGTGVPAAIATAVDAVRAELAAAPFAAPDAQRLAELGLGRQELAAAVRAGALLRVADGVYLLPGAEAAAARVLAGLPQPFTLSAARQALGTSRRVAVPLLELLDARGLTRRRPDDRRTVPGHE